MKQDLISEATVLEEVKKAIAQTLKVEKETIQPEHSLMRDLGAGSLDFLDINYRLEQAFGIKTARHFVLEHIEEMFGEGAAIVAGTSGKSTTTAMIAWILHRTGKDPTVMNGAVMKNFVTPDALFASALVGKGEAFVSDVDESDGSIARYRPTIAVVNNIALDHKSMDELRTLFRDFVGRSEVAVLNLDNEETAALVMSAKVRVRTYSLRSGLADLHAVAIRPAPDGVSFDLIDRHERSSASVRLAVPGEHNVSNALAAISAAQAYGLTLHEAAAALEGFAGTKRRLELVGSAGGVTVIDDFAHNPDKIAATLKALHAFPGRLLIMFQPHGFGPLKLMKDAFIDCLATCMDGGAS